MNNESIDSQSINLLSYLEMILNHKSLIVRITLFSFLLSIIISFLLPKMYNSTARILPPQQGQGLWGMIMGGGEMSGLAGDLLGKGNPADLYVSILSSEAISDKLIDRFNLIQVYDQSTRVDTYKALAKKANFVAGRKDGIVTIAVEDEDPKRAADMANAYVEELNKICVKLGTSGAATSKNYIEKRLIKAKADLSVAEDELKAFQAKNKALDIPEQTKGAIKGIADLAAQLTAEEVKLAGLRQTFTDASTEIKNQKAVVSSLKAQIAKMEGTGKGGSIPTVGSVPDIGQAYARLLREYKMQETLVEILTKQFEMYNLDESKDFSGIQVIQSATVPDKKSKPKRSFIVVISTFLAGVAGIFWALFIEYREAMTDEERQHWHRVILKVNPRSKLGTFS